MVEHARGTGINARISFFFFFKIVLVGGSSWSQNVVTNFFFLKIVLVGSRNCSQVIVTRSGEWVERVLCMHEVLALFLW